MSPDPFGRSSLRPPAAVRVVPATPQDCTAIAELHVACWRCAYQGLMPQEHLSALSVERRTAAWAQVLAEGRSELLVARLGDSIVGFVSYGPSRDSDSAPGRGEVWAIYVAPSAWSRGVGSALWQSARQRLLDRGHSTVSLWVIVGNQRALRFYLAAGFRGEPGSEKTFQIGGTELREVRLVFDNER